MDTESQDLEKPKNKHTRSLKNIRFRNKIVKRVTILMSIGALMWIIGMLVLGTYHLIVIPAIYILTSALSIALCAKYETSNWICNIQTILSISLPCIFQIIAGGAVSSGAVMAWSIIPLFSITTYSRIPLIMKWSVYTFAIIIVTVLVESFEIISFESVLPISSLHLLFFNTISTYLVVFYIGYYFVGSVERTRKNLSSAVQEVKDLNSALEKRNTDNLEGLLHARDIQNAFMKSEDHLRTVFTKLFLLREAKEYVSGDFIWAEQKKDFKYMLTGDCTSKGTSRGLLAMLMVSTADRILQENDFTDPGLFLTKFNDSIRENSSLDLASLKLNVSVTLLIVNAKNNKAKIASAGGCFLIKNHNDGKLKRYVSEHIGIGFENSDTHFNATDIDLNIGDVVYMYSDGFYKQHNELGEPFGTERFQKVISELDTEYSFIQKRNLVKELNEWQRNVIQTDDVLICGFEIEDPSLVYEESEELELYN